MALILPRESPQHFVFGYHARRKVNGRTTERTFGGRCGVEIWRWMHFHDSDFYYRVLVTRLRTVLTVLSTDYTDSTDSFLKNNLRNLCNRWMTYQLTTNSSASCQTGRFGRIALR